MSANPLISIVVPVYNASAYLSDCLDSLLGQTLIEIEVICVDDGSSDGSVELLRNRRADDARLKVIESGCNRGTFLARKAGIEAATGSYLTFLDADDTMCPDACSLFVDALKSSGADVVHGGVLVNSVGGVSAERIRQIEKMLQPRTPALAGRDILRALIAAKVNPGLWGKAYRTELVREACAALPEGCYPKAQDFLLQLAICSLARSYSSFHQAVVGYRYGAGFFGAARQDVGFCVTLCRQLDIVSPLRAFVKDRFPDDAEMPSLVDAVECRLAGECFSRMAGSLSAPEDCRTALGVLRGKTDDLTLIRALAKTRYLKVGESVRFLSRAGALALPEPPRAIRHVGILYHRYSLGGVQRVMASMIERLIRLGRRVTLFLEETPPEDASFDIPEGVEIVLLPPAGMAAHARAEERAVVLARELKDRGIDLMYYHRFNGENMFQDMLVCKWIVRVPFVIHYHTAYIHKFDAMDVLASERDRMLLHASAERIIALSRADALYMRGCGLHNAVYLPNPMPEWERSSSDDHGVPTIVWCARISPEKRPADALSVFAEVRRRVPAVRLIMVGGGADADVAKLRSTALELGVADAVEFAGYQKNARPYFARATVYLHTSELEGFLLTVLEAASLGIPSVMYALPWLEPIRDNGGVTQVPMCDVRAAADAVASILESAELRRKMSAAAKAKYDELAAFDLDAAWRGLLDEVASGRPVVEDPEVSAEDFRMTALQSAWCGEYLVRRIAALRAPGRRQSAAVRSPDAPLVSVIVPVYNVMPYLRQCLDSIRAQTLKDMEIICVDDGSTDGSLLMLKKAAADDHRIFVLTQPNAGAGAARNRGLAVARGRYLHFCDPDDRMEPNLLKTCVDRAEAECADVVTMRYAAFDDATGKELSRPGYPPALTALLDQGSRTVAPAAIPGVIFTFAGYSPWNKLFRREFIEKHRFSFQCTRRTNDAYFVMMALTHAKRIAPVDMVLYRYRRGVGNAATRKDALAGSFVGAFAAIRRKLEADRLFETFRPAYVNAALASLVFNLNSISDGGAFVDCIRTVRRRLGELASPEEVRTFAQVERAKKVYAALTASDPSPAAVADAVGNRKLKSVAARLPPEPDDPDVRRKLKALEQTSRQETTARKRLQAEVFDLKNSTAYRVGMFVTWPARRVYRMLKCYRENGLKYTLRRLVLGKGRGEPGAPSDS